MFTKDEYQFGPRWFHFYWRRVIPFADGGFFKYSFRIGNSVLAWVEPGYLLIRLSFNGWFYYIPRSTYNASKRLSRLPYKRFVSSRYFGFE